jgi:hypothetical protein
METVEDIPVSVWMCDAQACERIVAAVGERHARNVDRDRLVGDLLAARAELLASIALDSDGDARERAMLFNGVFGSAIEFKERLLDKRGHRYAARQILSAFSPSEFEALLRALDRVIDKAKALENENSCGGWLRLKRPPKEWFAAEVLPPVFERNFARPARISRRDSSKVDANAADGPFLRFALAVMREMGMSISRETVARALKDVRAGRERRKRRPTTID